MLSGQRIKDIPPIAVTEISGKEFGEGISRKELARAADALLRQLQRGDGLPNYDTGWVLRINRKGRGKMGDNPDLSTAESMAVAAIERLVERAVLAENHADVEHDNPQVAAIHRFYAPLAIGSALYRVKLTAKTFVQEIGKGKVMHALSAVEIENAPLGTVPAHEPPKASKPQAQPTTGRFISITELLKDAIMNDGKPCEL